MDELYTAEKPSQESEEISESSVTEEDDQNIAFIEKAPQWKLAITCLYDKKSPPLSSYASLFH